MDDELRQTERALRSNPENLSLRKELTSQYLRCNTGKVLFWRGGETGLHLPGSAVTFTHRAKIVYQLNTTQVEETANLLAVLDLNDIFKLLPMCPDSILDLETRILHPLNGRNQPNNYTACDQSNTYQYSRPYYDRQYIDPGIYRSQYAVTIPFFDAILGESSEVLQARRNRYWSGISRIYKRQLCDNNLDAVGSMPYPGREYIFKGFSIIPDYQTSIPDFIKIINASVFRVIIGTMSYCDLPARLVTSLPDPETPEAVIKLSNPVGPHYVFEPPLSLIHQQNYRIELIAKTPLTINEEVSILGIIWGELKLRIN